MQEKAIHDEIMLGFGFGYLSICDSIITGIKEIRQEIKLNKNIDIPQVHIVDHDYDSEKNKVLLDNNEFIIKIYGEEKARFHCDNIQSSVVIKELKKVFLDNIAQFD